MIIYYYKVGMNYIIITGMGLTWSGCFRVEFMAGSQNDLNVPTPSRYHAVNLIYINKDFLITRTAHAQGSAG